MTSLLWSSNLKENRTEQDPQLGPVQHLPEIPWEIIEPATGIGPSDRCRFGSRSCLIGSYKGARSG